MSVVFNAAQPGVGRVQVLGSKSGGPAGDQVLILFSFKFTGLKVNIFNALQYN